MIKSVVVALIATAGFVFFVVVGATVTGQLWWIRKRWAVTVTALVAAVILIVLSRGGCYR